MASSYYESVSLEEAGPWRDIVANAFSLSIVNAFVQRIQARYFSPTQVLDWADVGCGLGATSKVAARLGHRYTGVDSSAVNVDHCREHHVGAFVCEDWAEHQGEYDLITFLSSLHHFEDYRGAVAHAFELLRPGGVLVVDHEPTRLYARAYRRFAIHVRRIDYEVLRDVEIHWLREPSILPSDLPPGEVEYHWDYIPFVRRLRLKTRRAGPGAFCASYRKIMRKPI